MASWEDNIRKVTPYVPGEQPKDKEIIKLNTNENPYSPSPMVQAILKEVDYDLLRKYPDPNVSELRQTLADYHSTNFDNVFVGVGSDDVLAMAFLTFFDSEKPILFPDITYSFYDVWAELYRIPYEAIPLALDFSVDEKDYFKANGGVVIANPNAPTGLLMGKERIIEIVKNNPNSVVIVDEAYIDFANESVIDYVNEYDNLLVVRTFSKSRSLAGSRIGYAVGCKKLIDYLLAVRNSFNSYTMDSITIKVGVASVLDDKYFKNTVSKIKETREWFKDQMKDLGFSFPDSSSNFLFVTHKEKKAKEIFDYLRENKIFVRYFAKDKIDNYLRITIGTKEEMLSLLSKLKEIV